MADERLYVVGLDADNYMRLRAVRLDFTPGGGLVVIGGRNEQGKTCAVSILASTLGGEKLVPAVPLRRGETKGSTSVRLSNGLVVKRTYTAEGGGALTVTDGDGRKYASPQKMLTALLAGLAFDPMAFLRMDEKAQGETLRRLAGLDFAAQDAARKAAYDGRTDINRDLKGAEARLSALPAANPDAPAAEVSAAEIVQALDKAKATNAANATKRKAAADAGAKVTAAEAALKQAKDALAAAESAAGDAEDATVGLVDADIEPIQARLGSVESTNAAVRANAARAKGQAEIDSLRAKSERLTADIEKIDAEKAKAIAAAALPVSGLGFDPDGLVTLDGLPLKQASHARQLRTSLAIGAAQNPTLRAIATTDGEKLDNDNLALVAEFAKDHDLLFIMERVGMGAEIGIVIEDGSVLEDRREPADEKRGTARPLSLEG